MKIGNAVRILRTAIGKSQTDLAATVGVTASYLSLIETGKRNPSMQLLEGIAGALGVPLEELFGIASLSVGSGDASRDARSLAILVRALNEFERGQKDA